MKDGNTIITQLQDQTNEQFRQLKELTENDTRIFTALGYTNSGGLTGNGIVGQIREIKEELKSNHKYFHEKIENLDCKIDVIRNTIISNNNKNKNNAFPKIYSEKNAKLLIKILLIVGGVILATGIIFGIAINSNYEQIIMIIKAIKGVN